jgi:hypothetical protein
MHTSINGARQPSTAYASQTHSSVRRYMARKPVGGAAIGKCRLGPLRTRSNAARVDFDFACIYWLLPLSDHCASGKRTAKNFPLALGIKINSKHQNTLQAV